MNKKFIKKNIFMIMFMTMALVAVVILLIMVFFEHKSMQEYDTKKKELLEKIDKIVKQKYTPVKVNIARIKSDIDGYNKEIEKIQKNFGHPYAASLQGFVEEVGINLNDFKAKFGEFWESQKGKTTRDLIFRYYKVRKFSEDFPKHKSNWDEAMNVFMKKAQKATLEEITISNVDGIFLAAMGKGRRFSDSPISCLLFMKRMRNKMLDYFDGKKIHCESSDFSFNHDKEPLDGDIERIAQAWEIIADLGKRIADAKADPEKDALKLVSFTKRGLDGEQDGSYTLYRFNFTVNGDLNTIKRIVEKLYAAYKENRVYALRNIKLDRTVDGVEKILDESERLNEDSEFDTKEKADKNAKRQPGGLLEARRFGSAAPKGTEDALNPRSNLKKKTTVKAKEKKKVLTPKDRGYAAVIVGKNNICTAEFEVDYIVFDDSPK